MTDTAAQIAAMKRAAANIWSPNEPPPYQAANWTLTIPQRQADAATLSDLAEKLAREQDAVAGDVREKVARAIFDAERAFRGSDPVQDTEWRDYWSPGGPAAYPSLIAMRADAAFAAMVAVARRDEVTG